MANLENASPERLREWLEANSAEDFRALARIGGLTDEEIEKTLDAAARRIGNRVEEDRHDGEEVAK